MVDAKYETTKNVRIKRASEYAKAWCCRMVIRRVVVRG